MRVLVTGASGFIGSAIVEELLVAGHKVLGLVRSETAAEKLKNLGTEPQLGNVNDLSLIAKCATACDAVIHTAFNHDFSQFKANCEADRAVIQAFGDALAGTDKPVVITSGIGLLRYDRLSTEDDALNLNSEAIPRAASEEAASAANARGANVYTLRLPPTVHGSGDHGFVPMVAGMAKENEKSGYIGSGENRWPAVHRRDAARLYRLIIEQKPQQKVFHAVAEEGIAFRNIAEAIGEGLKLPTVSLSPEEAEKHFGWFLHFASLDCASSSEKTRQVLGWESSETNLLDDLRKNYF